MPTERVHLPRRFAVGFAAVLVAVTLAGCGVVQPSPTATTHLTAPSPTPRQVTLADAEQCPTTQPSPRPTGAQSGFFGWGSAHGNERLWVGGLGTDGVIVADIRWVEADGSIGIKFGWWREVAGKLTITGRRLDASAPPARGDIPDGYGTTGFQASGVWFPTEVCWEVTGQMGTTTLTFVTFVIKEPT